MRAAGRPRPGNMMVIAQAAIGVMPLLLAIATNHQRNARLLWHCRGLVNP